MVAPGVPCWGLGGARFDGYLFGGGCVGDSDVDGAVFEVVNRLGCVGFVPGYLEWVGTVFDAGFDEGVGED